MKSRGVVAYKEGSIHSDVSVGPVQIDKFEDTPGLEEINVPEHVLFLVDSDVTSTEVWNGVTQRQNDWARGDLAFLPGGTDLTSSYVSRSFNEYVIRLRPAAVVDAERSLDLADLDLRFFKIPKKDVFGISRSMVNLAEANRHYKALPMLIEAMEQSLHVALVHSLSEASSKIIKPQGGGLSVARRRKALDFIEENLSRSITLANIANAAAMSPYHFTRAFRYTMGITPVRYVWARRVVMAKLLLRDKAMPIAEVAFSCGFGDQSHFTTAFRIGTGATPGEYRKAVI